MAICSSIHFCSVLTPKQWTRKTYEIMSLPVVFLSPFQNNWSITVLFSTTSTGRLTKEQESTCKQKLLENPPLINHRNFKETFILFYFQLILHWCVSSDGATSAQRNAACMLIQVQFFSGCCLLSVVQLGDCSWGLGLNKASSTKPRLLLLFSHTLLCQWWQRPFRGCRGTPSCCLTCKWHQRSFNPTSRREDKGSSSQRSSATRAASLLLFKMLALLRTDIILEAMWRT